MTKLLGTIVAAILLGAPQLAIAQKGSPRVEYPKETRYEFDDDVVLGELQQPGTPIIQVIRRVQHPPLIQIRKDFIPELLESADEV